MNGLSLTEEDFVKMAKIAKICDKLTKQYEKTKNN